MVAAAPKIILIVLNRLFKMAKKIKLTCAVVPRIPVSLSFSIGGRLERLLKPVCDTISIFNDLENGMGVRNTLFAYYPKICEADYHGRASGAIPKRTTDAILVSHQSGAQEHCTPQPRLSMKLISLSRIHFIRAYPYGDNSRGNQPRPDFSISDNESVSHQP